MGKVNICDGSHLSLNDIIKFKSMGYSVVRSGHVGNQDAITLFLAQEDVSVFLDEYACGTMRVYRPAYKILNRELTLIGECDNKPVSHIRLAKDYNKSYNSVSSYHYNNLKKLYPNSFISTVSFLLSHIDNIKKAFKILLDKRPCSFEKFIDKNGHIYYYDKCVEGKIYFLDKFHNSLYFQLEEFANIAIKGLYNTNNMINNIFVDDYYAVTLDVDADISLLTLCDIDWANVDKDIEVIHFSGLEMINYMVKDRKQAAYHLENINYIIEQVIGIWTDIIPNSITISIVPTNILKLFLSDNRERMDKINEILNYYLKLNNLKIIRKNLWITKANDILKYLKKLTNEEIEILFKNIDFELCPRAFINSYNYLSSIINSEFENKRSDFEKLLFNYFIHKDTFDFKISKIDDMIFKYEKKLNSFKIGKCADLSQYDILGGKSIFVPKKIYMFSMSELKKISKRYMYEI